MPFTGNEFSIKKKEHLPEYLPPLFLLMKQAISTVSVRKATAHINPINQLCVDIPP